MWTQKIYRHSNKFQNPLHQNYKHIETLKSALGLNDQQIHSVVVFIGDSKFKTEMPDNVTYGGGYLRYIKSKTQPIFSFEEVNQLVEKIRVGRLTPSFKTNREHVKHVKNIVNEKLNKNPCPKCGSPMVIRKIEKGPNKGRSFWGCPHFPKCRGSETIV
jgi:restriction system protein